jgi:cell volume regulation protein A
MRRWLPIPQPALLLAAAAVAAAVIPRVQAPDRHVVQWVVSIALVAILFDGGVQIGRRAARRALAEIASLGFAGTLLTSLAVACFARYGFGFPWYDAALLAAAVAPTDPAVVFSVLGGREVEGRSGTILKGESGANDPVGIALMVSLVDAHRLSGAAAGPIAGRFALQLGVGTAIGLLAGASLRSLHRSRPLATGWLEPARAVAVVATAFAVATVAHGSGFLAVFLAGIMVGDEEHAPMRPIRRSFDWLSSAAEVVAFVVLGLTVNLHLLARGEVWRPALAVAAVLALVVRPLTAWCCLLGSRLRANERAFIAWAGLKGAVPILLGSLLLGARVSTPQRYYSIIVVVVMVSVVVQGGLVPLVARLLRVRLLPLAA